MYNFLFFQLQFFRFFFLLLFKKVVIFFLGCHSHLFHHSSFWYSKYIELKIATKKKKNSNNSYLTVWVYKMNKNFLYQLNWVPKADVKLNRAFVCSFFFLYNFVFLQVFCFFFRTTILWVDILFEEEKKRGQLSGSWKEKMVLRYQK